MSTWSAEQRRLLGALGVTVFERAGAADADAALSPALAMAARHAALHAALERAAGGRRLDALGLDLPRLRNSAAAKRALWPTLRALRPRS